MNFTSLNASRLQFGNTPSISELARQVRERQAHLQDCQTVAGGSTAQNLLRVIKERDSWHKISPCRLGDSHYDASELASQLDHSSPGEVEAHLDALVTAGQLRSYHDPFKETTVYTSAPPKPYDW
jgi:hypothetical protein